MMGRLLFRTAHRAQGTNPLHALMHIRVDSQRISRKPPGKDTHFLRHRRLPDKIPNATLAVRFAAALATTKLLSLRLHAELVRTLHRKHAIAFKVPSNKIIRWSGRDFNLENSFSVMVIEVLPDGGFIPGTRSMVDQLRDPLKSAPFLHPRNF
jgi:hypothetical protein